MQTKVPCEELHIVGHWKGKLVEQLLKIQLKASWL